MRKSRKKGKKKKKKKFGAIEQAFYPLHHYLRNKQHGGNILALSPNGKHFTNYRKTRNYF